MNKPEYEDGPQFNGNWYAFLPMGGIAAFALIIGTIKLAEASIGTIATGISFIVGY